MLWVIVGGANLPESLALAKLVRNVRRTTYSRMNHSPCSARGRGGFGRRCEQRWGRQTQLTQQMFSTALKFKAGCAVTHGS